ncbi:MAG TPA: tetratricopeptide repeat protein [Verrucomicrobiae bacterium]|nr:tetratricopeptide repeat protein [Verrucomicrobiae bacterium]
MNTRRLPCPSLSVSDPASDSAPEPLSPSLSRWLLLSLAALISVSPQPANASRRRNEPTPADRIPVSRDEKPRPAGFRHATNTPPAAPAQTIPDDAPPADLLLTTGYSAYQSGRYSDASSAFRRFFDLYGQSPEAQAARERILPMLAGSLLADGKAAEARPFLEEYLSLFPAGKARPEMSFWLGLTLFLGQGCAAAVQELDRFTAAYPHHEQAPNAAFLAALAARGAADLRGAADRFSKLTTAPDPLIAERSTLLQVQCQMDLGEADAALALLAQFVSRDPTPRQQALPAAQALHLGDEFLDRGNPEKAWRCYLLVPTRGRILRRHSSALADVERDLAASAASAPPSGRHQHLAHIRDAMLAEKTAIERIVDFDAARHMRLARAAFQLEWYREAFVAASEAAASVPDTSPLAADATFLSILSCIESRRWDKVPEQCASFLKHHPAEARAARVEFLAAHAHLELRDHRAAHDAFLAHNQSHPDFPEADRALFLAGYCALSLNLNDEATTTFSDVCHRYPASPLCEQARYWRAMAAVFAKDYDAIAERFDAYLAAHPTGAFKQEALYRKAAARYGKREFPEARKALDRWLKDFAGHALTDEVRALHGDACLACGEIDAGLESYRAVTAAQPTLQHYAQFQIGKALRLTGRHAELESHFRTFVAAHPESPRIAEAFHWLAWALRQQGRHPEAADLYRTIIARVGPDPANRSVEPLLLDFAALHRTPEDRSRLEGELRRAAAEANAASHPALAARCTWLISKIARREPARARQVLLELTEGFHPNILPPTVAIDLAELLVALNRAPDAEPYLRHLLDAGPGTPEFPRALAGLGLIASARGDWIHALELFDRFEREAGQSLLKARVIEARADILLGQRRHAEAIAQMEKLLEAPSATGAAKARALCLIGESHEALGHPEKAMPCYQRVYVMYGAHRPWVARAYLASGRVLEQLKLWDGARKTYQEFLAREDLAPFAEHSLAQAQLGRLP